ncbi:MAG: D-glucuronyl C5-epimerase family protein [Candidatus Cloacimonadaceae bacterium]|nr:D-glucuronyl C5-epimerase family protein [Candidatus Cloacimonadaceae bacterium]
MNKAKLLAFLIIIIAHALLWQFGEGWIMSMGEKYSELLTGKPLNQRQLYDSEGIPVQSYRAYGLQYNPLFIAAQAKRDYDESPRNTQRFKQLSSWLAERAEYTDSGLWLPYGFDLPDYELRAPWHSGLAQAVALSVFARRQVLEPEGKWADLAKQTFNTLKPGSKLTLETEGGGLWYMEYPSRVDPYVLNGMMSILLELDTYHKLSGDKEASDLFERGYIGLITKLDEFDYHGFSLYGIGTQKAGRKYHQKHIAQLAELNAIKPHPKLEYYQRRWQSRDRYPVLVQIFFNPRPRRIAAFVISLLLPVLLLMLGFWVWRRRT